MYNRGIIDWKGKKEYKPSELRCFTYTANLLSTKTKFYFCVYYARTDWERGNQLATTHAIFTNDLWVSTLNLKLHFYNLKIAQDKMMRTVGSIDCNAHIMEPIKYEIRLRVNNEF